MFIFEGWTGKFFIVYLSWAVVVMFAFFLWASIRSRSILGFVKGLVVTLTFSLLASLGWIIGSFVVLGVIAFLLDLVGLSSLVSQVTLFTVMALAMTIGAVLGWKYLLNEVGPDPKDWNL